VIARLSLVETKIEAKRRIKNPRKSKLFFKKIQNPEFSIDRKQLHLRGFIWII
jgi:hypothetical protein